MNTYRQRFTNYLATAGAFLACVLWVNQCHSAASFFRFAAQDSDKATPACITDTACQPAVLDHPFDVQVFRSDVAVPIDQITSDLVVHVPAGVSHLGVQGRHTLLCFLPSGTTSLCPRELAAPSSQFLQVRFERSATSKMLAVTGRDKLFKANVNSYAFRAGSCLGFLNLNCKADVPLSVFPNDLALLELSFGYLSVPSNSDSSDVLKAKLSVDDFAPTTVARHRIIERVESVRAFESRATILSASLQVGEESLASLLKLPKRLLGRSKIEFCIPRIVFSLNLEPSRLLAIRPGRSGSFPTQITAVESSVIEPAVRLKARRKLTPLAGVGEESELERLDQLLTRLIFNVFANGSLANVAYRPGVVAASPESRYSAPERRELPPEKSGRATLKRIHDACWRCSGISLNKQMNVIRHYLPCMNCPVVFRSNFIEYFVESASDVVNQNRSSILRAPNQVVLQAEDCGSIFSVSVAHASILYRSQLSINRMEGENSPTA